MSYCSTTVSQTILGILYEYVVYLDKYYFGTPAAPWEKLKIGGGLAYDFSMIYVTFAIYTP